MSDSGLSSVSSCGPKRRHKKKVKGSKRAQPSNNFDINSIISNPMYTAGIAGVAVAGLMYFFGPSKGSSDSSIQKELDQTKEVLGKYEKRFKEFVDEKGELIEVIERQQVNIRNLQEYVTTLSSSNKETPQVSPTPEETPQVEVKNTTTENLEDYINKQFESQLEDSATDDDFATPSMGVDKGKEEETTFFRDGGGD